MGCHWLTSLRKNCLKKEIVSFENSLGYSHYENVYEKTSPLNTEHYYGVCMNNKLKAIGKYNEEFNSYLPYIIKSSNIYQSNGLEKHISKRHPDCVKYVKLIPQIIAYPDYIGVNPNEKNTSFELVKCISENIQIGIKLDTKDDYLYVATPHNNRLQIETWYPKWTLEKIDK